MQGSAVVVGLSLLVHAAAHTAKTLAQGCRASVRVGVAIDVLARGVKAVCCHGDALLSSEHTCVLVLSLSLILIRGAVAVDGFSSLALAAAHTAKALWLKDAGLG